MELLKDEYPSACILSHCIWPYENGEVIVQNYNALLTLAKLQESVDGIIISQNESLSSICRKTLSILRPSFDDMNDVVAHSLASIFLPASWRSVEPCERNEHPRKTARDRGVHDSEDFAKDGIHGAGMPVRLLSDLVSKLCAHPGYRMLSLRFTPQASHQTHVIVIHYIYMHIFTHIFKRYRSLVGYLFSRHRADFVKAILTFEKLRDTCSLN